MNIGTTRLYLLVYTGMRAKFDLLCIRKQSISVCQEDHFEDVPNPLPERGMAIYTSIHLVLYGTGRFFVLLRQHRRRQQWGGKSGMLEYFRYRGMTCTYSLTPRMFCRECLWTLNTSPAGSR